MSTTRVGVPASAGHPLRLMMITPWYRPQKGGVATAASAIAGALGEQGVEVSVLLKKSGTRHRVVELPSAQPNVRLFSLLLRAPVDPERPLRRFVAFLVQAPATLRVLLRLVREQAIDAINVHYPTSSDIYAVAVRALTGRPLIVTIHGSDLLKLSSRPWLHRLIVRAVLKAADRIVYSTEAFYREGLAPRFPWSATKLARIPMAIDWRDFSGEGPVPAGVPPSFVLCVAKLAPVKGIDMLLKAFAEIAPDHPGVSLVIAGDGPERDALASQVAALSLQDRVVFTGAVERAQVIGLMQRSLFLVLPSRFESFGLVLLEAHACGKAVVSTRAGGIPEVVEEGVSGLLADVDDPRALAGHLRTLLDDPRRCEQIGVAGRNAIGARGLTWQAAAARYLDVIRELRATTSPPR